MPYVSRKLGAENLGINTYTQSLVLLLGLFINSSILQIGAREIARQDRISRTKHLLHFGYYKYYVGWLLS